MRKVRQNALFFVIVKNATGNRRLGTDETPPFPPVKEAAMLQQSKKKSSAVSSPGRGRPRKYIAPDALSPFEKRTVAPADKQDNNWQENNWKGSTPKRKGQRLSPVTSDRSYSADEVEFMNALAEFKRASGRTFPTCSEILNILRGLGYEKVV